MANIDLSAPPIITSITDGTRVSLPWIRWFNDLHRKLSVKNNQVIASASAINVDARYVSLATTGATYAVTLAAPTVPGLLMVIEMITRTGAFDVTLSLANVVGGSAATTCTWNTAGDTLVLLSKANKWLVIKEQGVALT